jgi:protein involved in polysaccharide export with SLBB domain
VSDRLENWVEIQGAVKRPGRYQYAESLDVVALLDRAGRTWPDLMEQRAALDRVAPDGTFQSRDLPLGDILAGRAEKVLLQPRDVIRVYSKWDLQDRFSVTISGEVRSPGSFPYREGMTLRDLVLKAGGYGSRSTRFASRFPGPGPRRWRAAVPRARDRRPWT